MQLLMLGLSISKRRTNPATTNVLESRWVCLVLLNLFDLGSLSCKPSFRRPDKGLAGRGGWRKEILPMPEIQTCLLPLVSDAPDIRRGTHFWKTTPPATDKITKLICQAFLPVITDFRLPILPVIAPN